MSDPNYVPHRGQRMSKDGGAYPSSPHTSNDARGPRKGKGSVVPGLIITLIVLALELVFLLLVVRSQMVPMRYIVVVAAMLLVLTILVFISTHRTNRKGRFALGTVIAVLVSAVMLYGIVALFRVTGALNNITSTKTEVSYVGVYVLMEDEAETLNDLEDDTFGILRELDRTGTDGALEQLDLELNVTVTTQEYDGLIGLIEALYSQECRAILLNSAYIDVIADIEGYEDIEDRIREVTSLAVEEEVEEEADETESTTSTDASETAFTIYISGSDSRTGLQTKSRSDVNILATINTETHQVLLVSTPRDYYVELSISNGNKDKLTHAGIYGVNVSMDTLSMLYGIDVDYYFKVCFEGLEEIVDALGGVTVYSDYAFSSGGYTYVQGYNDVNGEEALAFARERYSFSEGDRQRGKNQMALIRAMIDKALSPEILINYGSILAAAEDNFETSFSYDMIAAIVNDQLSTGASWNIVTYSVDGSDGHEIPWSMSSYAYVMIPDEDTVATASELMQAVLNGEIISDPDQD